MARASTKSRVRHGIAHAYLCLEKLGRSGMFQTQRDEIDRIAEHLRRVERIQMGLPEFGTEGQDRSYTKVWS